MIREDRDPGFWNAIALDPDVRPWIGHPDASLDLTDLVENPAVRPVRTSDHGGFVFVGQGYGRYELHTMFAKAGRGRAVLSGFEAAARWLFTTTDALEIVTKTAGTNRAAALMARLAGFRPLFTRRGAWHDGSDLTFYAITFDEWVQRDPTLEAEGHAFHAMLEAAKALIGSELPTHPDDPPHDRAAGAARLMALSGQPEKAVETYNRWAWLAGYRDIELLESEPPLIDVRDATVTVRDGQLEVVQCQS